MSPPKPDDFRRLEDAAIQALESIGAGVFRTGQEHAPTLQRWSPDFWTSLGFWADAKIRNDGYRCVLVEWAEIVRHTEHFPNTVYVFIDGDTEEPFGWMTADEALVSFEGEVRRDHGGTGSGDPYVLIDTIHVHRDFDELRRWSPIRIEHDHIAGAGLTAE